MTPAAEILLLNGKILAARGDPTALAVAGGKVLAIGEERDIRRLASSRTTILDCAGRTVIPGIVDAHCHVLAAAATGLRVNCRPDATREVGDVVDALRRAIPYQGEWVHGFGYDDSPVGLGRHPDRHDLDRVSTERPVRLDHRSGHACVLNSRALASVGIDRRTPNPPGGLIARNHDGEPTGLLLEMTGWLRERAGRSEDPSPGQMDQAMRDFGKKLLAYGITAVTDAGPSNGLDRWRYFRRVTGDGTLPLRVTMMVGFDRLEEMQAAGLPYGAAANQGLLTVGHAKIMLTASTGQMSPDPAGLTEMVAHAHALGFPVAIHAVERDAVVASALAIGDVPPLITNDDNRLSDRIEHCAECPPDVLDLVAQSGATVAPNPGFLHYDGDRYLHTVATETLPHLYPVGALADRGIPTILGSDAPVVEPNPWASMAAAVSRQSAGGLALGGIAVPSVSSALEMHTGGGRITPGRPADLAVVKPDPLAAPLDALSAAHAALTIVAGRVAWREPDFLAR